MNKAAAEKAIEAKSIIIKGKRVIVVRMFIMAPHSHFVHRW